MAGICKISTAGIFIKNLITNSDKIIGNLKPAKHSHEIYTVANESISYLKRSEAIELATLMDNLVSEVNDEDTEIKIKGKEIVSNLKNIFLSSDKSGFFPNLFDTLKRKITLFTNLLTKLVSKRRKQSLNSDLQDLFDTVLNNEGRYDDQEYRQDSLNTLYDRFSELTRQDMVEFLGFNEIELQGKIIIRDLKDLLGKYFYDTRGLKASNYQPSRMNTRSQGLNDNLDVTRENDLDLIDDSINHENAGTGLPLPTGVVSLGELNNKQTRISGEVDQLQIALETIIGGQAKIGIDQGKLQTSVTALTSSISALEGAQTSTRSRLETELNKKASIVDMRNKIEKQGERLMEQIEKVNKEVIRIEADIKADDSKIVGLGDSINDLNAETEQIKQNLRALKNQINSANQVETDLWDHLTGQISALAAQVKTLEGNTKLDEFKALYEGLRDRIVQVVRYERIK